MSDWQLPDAERGQKIWAGRRRQRFKVAVYSLLRSTPATGFDALLTSADHISERIASLAPETVTTLPRGYELRLNKLQERSLCRGRAVFSTSLIVDLPTREDLEQLARDVDDGWLDEVTGAIGKRKGFLFDGE